MEHRAAFSVCRVHYAGVLLWQGAWGEAETELETASRELLSMGSETAGESLARLGELRRRQGRRAEALAYFEQAGSYPMVALDQAHIAFDVGDSRGAIDYAERFLRRVAAEDRAERVIAHELLVRAHIALGELEPARSLLTSTTDLVSIADTLPLRAYARLTEGHVALAAGNAEAARQRYEDAVDQFQHSGASYEKSHARIDLAQASKSLGRVEAATREAKQALRECEAQGSLLDHGLAQALLDSLVSAPPARLTLPAGLSAREGEVLGCWPSAAATAPSPNSCS